MLVLRAFCIQGHDIFIGFYRFMYVFTSFYCCHALTVFTWYKPNPGLRGFIKKKV